MAGFDPNQPRDEIGRWTEVGNAARAAAGLEPERSQDKIRDRTEIGAVPTGGKDLAYYRKLIKNGFSMDHPDGELLEEIDQVEEQFEEEYGQELEEYAAEIGEHYKQELEKSDVYMRTTEASLEKALKDEEFKNTFMTGTTEAEYEANEFTYEEYIENRIRGENQALGIPEDTPAEKRPIYGYWSQDPYGFGREKSVVSYYGDVVVKFDKKKLGKNLTFSGADSLDDSAYIRSSFPSDPNLFSVSLWWNKKEHTSSSGEYVDKPSANAYWEAQIFDRSIANVQKVIFTGGAGRVSKNLLRQLDEKGIPWEILDT